VWTARERIGSGKRCAACQRGWEDWEFTPTGIARHTRPRRQMTRRTSWSTPSSTLNRVTKRRQNRRRSDAARCGTSRPAGAFICRLFPLSVRITPHQRCKSPGDLSAGRRSIVTVLPTTAWNIITCHQKTLSSRSCQVPPTLPLQKTYTFIVRLQSFIVLDHRTRSL